MHILWILCISGSAISCELLCLTVR